MQESHVAMVGAIDRHPCQRGNYPVVTREHRSEPPGDDDTPEAVVGRAGGHGCDPFGGIRSVVAQLASNSSVESYS
jgi:hypothetical protein